jgi:hypothetical protein
LKRDDFETEREFRAVVPAAGDEYAYVDYQDALYAVILGERFPRWQIAGVVEFCSSKGVEVHEIAWERGRPIAKPLA